MVYLLSQGGINLSFQIPCKFAGCVPCRDDEISKYLPYWYSNATIDGSSSCLNEISLSPVGLSEISDLPKSKFTRLYNS